jgi:Domain of Unknown Function with PDB structure (DUF3857)
MLIRTVWLLTLLYILPSVSAPAPQAGKAWSAIPADELALKDDPFNPGAKAIILFREIAKDDTKAFEFEHYRIKILTDDGRSYGDVEIPYAEKVTSVEDIRARVVQPDGKTVDFSGQIFDKLVMKAKKVKVQVKAFTLPEVRTGSVLEYSYLIHWHSKPPDVLEHPEMYTIAGTDSTPTTHWVIPDELSIRRSRFTLLPLPRAKVVWTSIGVTTEMGPARQPDGSYAMEVQNVPAFIEEEFMPPEDAVKACVDFFYIVGYIGDARDFWTSYVQRRADAMEPFLSRSKAIRRAVDETVSTSDAPEIKLRKLYDFVQQFAYTSVARKKTKRDGGERLKPDKSLDDLLKRGFGAGNEINLLFVALAREAGFTAAPVLLTARDKNLFRPNLLDASQLNAMVSWVQIGSKDYYLDPPTLFCPFDLLPWNETDTQGYRIAKFGGQLIRTPYPKSGDAVIERKGLLQLDVDGNLQGHLKVIFSGQEALQRRLAGRDDDEAGRRKALVDEVKGWLPPGGTVDLIDLNKWEQSAEPLRAEFVIKAPGYTSGAGTRMLAALGVFQASQKPIFQTVRRSQHVYFPYPYRQIDEIDLLLPNGLRVERLPAPRSQTVPSGGYEISCQLQGDSLRISRRMTMEGIFFKSNDYQQLRAFYNNIRSGDEQQIVLQNTAGADFGDHK